MLWAGLDEAGYGPLLGPLCHGLCVLRLSSADEADLWKALAPAVSRCPAPDGAIAVDDSKRLYDGRGALPRLRSSVECFLACASGRTSTEAAASLLERLLPAQDVQRIEADAWGRTDPTQAGAAAGAPPDEPRRHSLRTRLSDAGVAVLEYGARALSARDFNRRMSACENKADAAWEQVAVLVRRARELAAPGASLRLTVDKQGGRKFYSARLGEVFRGSLPWCERETEAASVYRLEDRGVEVRVEFREKADRDCFPVALASMAAKLTRELLMQRFNAYFGARQPGLKPTAGYGLDARRFLAETAALRARLRVPDEDLIRAR